MSDRTREPGATRSQWSIWRGGRMGWQRRAMEGEPGEFFQLRSSGFRKPWWKGMCRWRVLMRSWGKSWRSAFICVLDHLHLFVFVFSLHRTQESSQSISGINFLSIKAEGLFTNVHRCPKILQKCANILNPQGLEAPKSTGVTGRWDWEAAKRLQPTPCRRQRIQRTRHISSSKRHVSSSFNATSWLLPEFSAYRYQTRIQTNFNKMALDFD